jgi:hypothetical protein
MITDLQVDGGGLNACVHDPPCGQANYSTYAARAITRTTFARLTLVNTRVACLSIAFDWINRVEQCVFAQCYVGLHLWSQANNANVVENNFYGNRLPVVIEQGAQISVRGNVIEGNDGPVSQYRTFMTASDGCCRGSVVCVWLRLWSTLRCLLQAIVVSDVEGLSIISKCEPHITCLLFSGTLP